MQYIKIDKSQKEYPERLRQIKDAPQELYVQGNIDLLNRENIIAIVGSRTCTEYGKNQALKFSRYLAAQGICVISGLAVGIDTQAHRNSMKEDGKTIAVLGGGFNNIYPKENIGLYREIIKNGGCVISEYSPDVEPNTLNFPKRNRIIAGLAIATLVVEAAYRSGSTITAKLSKIQYKPVFAIPSDLSNKKGVGTNMLIQKGSRLVKSPKEILEFLNIEEKNKDVNFDIENLKYIKPEYKQIYEFMKQKEVTNIEEIQGNLKLDMQELNVKLTMMELDGIIQKLPGSNYKSIPVIN